MKKLIFLLFPFLMLAQNPTNFPYGIKNPAATSDSAPAYFVTSQTDNIYKKTPAVLVAFKSDLPVSYAIIVYVNDISPLTATIFDDENPPTTNDNAFKADVDNLYIGTDASTWVYNGSTYVTKSVPASSNFKIVGTGVDAGSNKTSSIYREGAISSDGSIGSNIGYYVNRNGSNTAQIGGFTNYSNAIGSNSMMFQLNGSNGLDLWNYASSTWNKRFTFSSDGDFLANGDIIGVLGTGKRMILGATTSTGVYKYNFLNDRSLDTSFARLFLLEGKFTSSQVGVASMFTLKMTVPTGSPILTPTGPGMLFAFQNNAGVENFIGRLSVSTNGIVDNTGRLNLDVANAGSLNTVMSLYGSGNATIGTTTDNGLDKLQVNGSISATSYTGSATLTGTPTAPTATAGTNTTQIATTAFVQAVDANVVHKTGEETIGLGEKYFTDNVNFTSIAVSGQAIGRVAVSPNEFVIKSQLDLKAPLSSPTFTGTVVLPSTTSIGTVTNTELSYVDGVTSSIQTQLNGKQSTLTNPVTGTGTTNYIAKFTGSGTIGNSQIIDNGTNVLIGTTTDNGVDKLQVNGSISATSYTGSATLTGTPTAPTATVGTNTTQIATTAFVQNAMTSGTYVPTFTNTTNISSSTLNAAYYTKINNIITVTIAVQLTLTATADTVFTFSLPVSGATVVNGVGQGNLTSGGGSVNAYGIVDTTNSTTAQLRIGSAAVAGSGAGVANIIFTYSL